MKGRLLVAALLAGADVLAASVPEARCAEAFSCSALAAGSAVQVESPAAAIDVASEGAVCVCAGADVDAVAPGTRCVCAAPDVAVERAQGGSEAFAPAAVECASAGRADDVAVNDAGLRPGSVLPHAAAPSDVCLDSGMTSGASECRDPVETGSVADAGRAEPSGFADAGDVGVSLAAIAARQPDFASARESTACDFGKTVVARRFLSGPWSALRRLRAARIRGDADEVERMERMFGDFVVDALSEERGNWL